MIVLKFGGTSVGGAEPIQRVGKIIAGCLDRSPVIVSSAVGGVTNRLFRIVEKALANDDWKTEYDELVSVHKQILSQLKLSVDLVDSLLQELAELVHGIALIRECTPRTNDYLVSFGERLAVRILAAHLREAGVEATACDSFDVGLVTDSRYGAARPVEDVDDRIKKALQGVAGVPIITGYIGKDSDGNITTLGRGGSDYSAAIFGAALDAEEIQIWTDVDGVMSADPRIVDGARLLEKLSFAEAAELAFYGAKVIHPATIIPAVRKNIPLRVLNSYRPEFQGTVIVADLDDKSRRVKSIATKGNVCVVNIVAPPMLMQYGFIERIADVFSRHEVVIDMIATSEVSVSMTTAPSDSLWAVVEELSEFAEVSVENDMSQVSVVGEALTADVELAGRVFGTFAKLKVRLELISFGATRNNLSVVVSNDRLGDVVAALHSELFSQSP